MVWASSGSKAISLRRVCSTVRYTTFRTSTPAITHRYCGPSSVFPIFSGRKAARLRSPTSTADSVIWTPLKRVLSSSTPMLNRAGNTSPWGPSPETSPVDSSSSAPSTTTVPITAAPTMDHGDWMVPVATAAMTMPGSTAWLMASVSIDCFRSTSQIPGRAQVTAVTIARIITHSTKLMPSPPCDDAVSPGSSAGGCVWGRTGSRRKRLP